MTTPIVATAAQALELLERVVADVGEDYVYPLADVSEGCLYVKDGVAACIAGKALALAGVPLDDLATFDHPPTIATNLPRTFASPDAAMVLRAAQDKQDRGWTWGDALEAARSMVTRLAYA